MGYTQISLKLPTDYAERQLRKKIEKRLRTKDFSYQIENKSLDACRKNNIHWLIRVGVMSEAVDGSEPDTPPPLRIPHRKTDAKAVVVGSGPAGFFSAFVLQKAGINTTIIERGSKVDKRASKIRKFEKEGLFSADNNYAFGEGGAGTFSDGKLTSRSKHISKERQFILSSYVAAGAPEEIQYMARPHLGSDNLKRIVANLREEFLNIGGNILFNTKLESLRIKDSMVSAAVTNAGDLEADHFIIAAGNAAHETYRMLIKKGVSFRTKNFAIGCRVEHPQELINLAQWGRESLPGVSAAEYRLTSKGGGNLPVYTFCMCPGGVVVPSTAYKDTNIVNGMSRYGRAGRFANSACVAGISIDKLLGRDVSALEALNWLSNLERTFFSHSSGFQAPFCSIQNFIHKKMPSRMVKTSYPFGLKPAPLWKLLPSQVTAAITEALKDFSRKVKGFGAGIALGLESKTSSPIQVLRDKNGLCEGFDNLYMVGEGSGYAGGIISSGADGIRAAMQLIGGRSTSHATAE